MTLCIMISTSLFSKSLEFSMRITQNPENIRGTLPYVVKLPKIVYKMDLMELQRIPLEFERVVGIISFLNGPRARGRPPAELNGKV